MNYPSPIDYQSPQNVRISKMASLSFFLGLLSVPLGGTIVIPIIAVTLGIIAANYIGKARNATGGMGYAVAGMSLGSCGLLFNLVLIGLLIPSIGSHDLPSRSQCGASLTGILKGFNVYGVENSDMYPVAPGTGGIAGYPNWRPADTTTTTSDDALLAIQKQGGASPTNGDPLQCAWMLVLRGTVSGKSFICKSDPAPLIYASATSGTHFYNNFSNITATTLVGTLPQTSYGFAYPWGNSGKDISGYWKNTVDSSIPIAADTGSGLGIYDPSGVGDASSPKYGNSGNHHGEGQNVAFADAHVEFSKKPTVGQGGDNIYTMASTSATPSNYGLPITSQGVPGAWDVELLPQRTTSSSSW